MTKISISIAAAMAVVAVFCVQAAPRIAPIETDAIMGKNASNDTVDFLVASTLLAGYKCDSVSSAFIWNFSVGFDLYCNRFRYKYEIADKGGKWIVTVK